MGIEEQDPEAQRLANPQREHVGECAEARCPENTCSDSCWCRSHWQERACEECAADLRTIEEHGVVMAVSDGRAVAEPTADPLAEMREYADEMGEAAESDAFLRERAHGAHVALAIAERTIGAALAADATARTEAVAAINMLSKAWQEEREAREADRAALQQLAEAVEDMYRTPAGAGACERHGRACAEGQALDDAWDRLGPVAREAYLTTARARRASGVTPELRAAACVEAAADRAALRSLVDAIEAEQANRHADWAGWAGLAEKVEAARARLEVGR